MSNVHELNQIFCDSGITIKTVNMTSLLFVDSLAVSKSRYSIVDNYINLLDPANTDICLYQHRGSTYYYEYEVDLNAAGVEISGIDKYGNILTHLREGSANDNLIFVDGYKLLPSQFQVTSNNSFKILNAFISDKKHTVIIYTSASLIYCGTPWDTQDKQWNFDKHSFILDDYTYLRYLFFINGELITRDKIYKINDTVTINVNIRKDVDIISYYRLPIDTENVLFYADPGYFSYGPKDISGLPVPEIHDTEISFDKIVRLAIDDVRYGFFIRELDGNGCAMITSTNFETKVAYCTAIVPFSNNTYTKDEYFVQVPNARSILKYISEYDLSRMLMPELLGSFQKLLLDETYDSIQRLKNIRSINNVDSYNIGKLINFMGLNLNINNLSLEKKHALLEELTNFYKIVGTRESYNFYNTMAVNSRIIQIEQLFTPIRDIFTINDRAERYVDFRTAEELGAITHRAYDYPVTDYGTVDTLASPVDSFTNQPRNEGTLTNNEIPAVFSSTRKTQIMDDSGNITTVENTLPLNPYILNPSAGPNKAEIDYGSVSENAVNFYDYGSVANIIKGKWIEWTTWDRPTNWYPTNHVDVSVQVPSDVNYHEFMTEFKNTFYDIASTVLYIHSIIEVYMFGKENPWLSSDADEATGGAASFDILTAPLYYDMEYTFTNDPARQDYRAY